MRNALGKGEALPFLCVAAKHTVVMTPFAFHESWRAWVPKTYSTKKRKS